MRHATAEDIPILVELGERMHAESRYSAFDYDREKIAKTLASLIHHPHGLVLVVGDPVHGFFLGYACRMWFGADLEANDLAMYLLPEKRRGTSAARLVNAYKVWAKGLGAKDIKIGVSTGIQQERTGLFYERMGFRRFASNHVLGG